MLRRVGVLVVLFLAVGAAGAACSSGSSKSHASPTAGSGDAAALRPVLSNATVLANGTVVVGGTAVSARVARAAIAAATQQASASPQIKDASGSPVPGQTTQAPGQNSPAPGGTSSSGQVATALPPIVGTAVPRTVVAVPATAVPVAPSDGFSLDVPNNPSGTFDVRVKFTGTATYDGFNVQLRFDSNLLQVTGIDGGSALGAQSFCAPAIINPGQAELGCTALGTATYGPGAIAVFHFRATGSGSSSLHFATYAEAGEDGTFFLDRGSGSNPQPLTAPTHDSTVTVS